MEKRPDKQEHALLRITDFDKTRLRESADLFINAFSKPPWNDRFESEDPVMDFFRAFIDLPNFKGYRLTDDCGRIVGLSIGFIKPWLKDGELRHEYFLDQYCISPALQGKGLGTCFMKEIEERLKRENIRDILLNTGLASPAYRFYRKMGFRDMKEYGFLSKEL